MTIGLELTDYNNVTWTLYHIEYADNQCLITATVEETTKAFASFWNCLTKLGMQMSRNKTKAMVINKQSSDHEHLQTWRKNYTQQSRINAKKL